VNADSFTTVDKPLEKTFYKLSFGMDKEKNSVKISLIRILGNDLPPLHSPKQTLMNLKFILENEASFPNCEKLFLINQILDLEIRNEIIELLGQYNFAFKIIPFNINNTLSKSRNIFNSKFKNESLDFEKKILKTKEILINSMISINSARNLSFNFTKASDIVLVFDGNCFLTTELYRDFYSKAASKDSVERVYVFPMHRLANFDIQIDLRSSSFNFEPQVGFSTNSEIRFNEDFHYGHRSKVELLNRLAIQGYWNEWTENDACVELPDEEIEIINCKGVLRLPSWTENDKFIAKPPPEKGMIREQSLNNLFEYFINSSIISTRRKMATAGSEFSNKLLIRMVHHNQQSLDKQNLDSFTSKKIPHGKLPLNYYTSYAPNYKQFSCDIKLDFIVRMQRNLDEINLLETSRYDADWLKLQSFIIQVLNSSLQANFKNHRLIQVKLEALICNFLLCPKNGMYPSLRFSQQLQSHFQFKGSYDGRNVVDFNRFYLFIIGISRIFGILSCEIQERTLEWIREFLRDLEKNRLVLHKKKEQNNILTINLLQELSIVIFLNDSKKISIIITELITLFNIQFEENGSQPFEEVRKNPVHYQLYNLQFWCNINLLLKSNFTGDFSFDVIPSIKFVYSQLSKFPDSEIKSYYINWVENLNFMSNFDEHQMSISTLNSTDEVLFKGYYSQGSPPFIMFFENQFWIDGYSKKSDL